MEAAKSAGATEALIRKRERRLRAAFSLAGKALQDWCIYADGRKLPPFYNLGCLGRLLAERSAMSDRDPAGADHLSMCYREVARAIRKVIPTLKYLRSREELECVAACYERLAEHRDNVCLVDESTA